MQKWEYKFINRARGIDDTTGESAFWAKSWNIEGEKLEAQIAELGNQGWELVNIVSISSVAGAYQVDSGGGAPFVADFAGLTTHQSWVFKRPKP